MLDSPLESDEHLGSGARGLLIHHTRASGLRVAAAMEHEVSGVDHVEVESETFPDWARTTFACQLRPGQKLRVVKIISYGWSERRSLPALRDQVVAAAAGAHYVGWDGLLREQRQFLDNFWDIADVTVDGDQEIQQAVRFGLYHVLQAGARAEKRPIAAKGLTGPGYDGHVFWDTEMFVLPVLTYTQPDAVVSALSWRHATLEVAQERAQTLGLAGAAFPWRTIRGQECSAYWPAGTAAFHIGADIADAVQRYVNATGNTDFEAGIGLELLVQTARLWRSLGHHDRHGRFHIDGVTGPDEYTAVVRDNVYTNLMAQRNLLAAADAATRHSPAAHALGVTEEETAAWRDAAAAITIPYDHELGVHAQSEGFTRLQEWDFAATGPDCYPLLLNFPYFDLYRKQVVKQPDLVLAMHWRGDAFTPEQKAANFAYYEARTVRDSSLSACTQAILAAEVGQPELAHDYLGEAALMDLRDLNHNTRDGVHVASLAGTWLALVAGLGGMRDHGGELSFAPRLPSRISRLEFALLWHGLRLGVRVEREQVTYSLRDGAEGATVRIRHYGSELQVSSAQPVTVPVPQRSAVPRPDQPHGRRPSRREPEVGV